MKNLTRNVLWGGFLFMIIVFISCETTTETQQKPLESELEAGNLIEQSLTYFDGKPYSELSVVKHQERLMNELADIYVGFAGIRLDPNDQEHIYISLAKKGEETFDRDSVFNTLTSIVRDRLTRTELDEVPAPDFRFTLEEAEYSFLELQYIRDILNPVIHQRNDIIKSFIDTKNNVFKIGIINENNIDDYEKLINKYSLSDSAIKIYKTGFSENSNKPTAQKESVESKNLLASNHTIRDRRRPFEGGLKIVNDSGIPCTLGFNVKVSGFDGWITNSSCTNTFSSSSIDTDTEGFQPDASTINNRIGFEFRDYEGIDFGGNKHRYSDASIFTDDDFSNFGKIIRTEYPKDEWGQSGSLVVDNVSEPWFEIVDDDRTLMVGMRLHKVGQGTGWTRGELLNTCTDVSCNDFSFSCPIPAGWTLKCQIQSEVYATNSDKGAPMFLQVLFAPTAADLIGIFWGANPQDKVSYISPMSGIRKDFSNETIKAHSN
jgi:hypothetical protein